MGYGAVLGKREGSALFLIHIYYFCSRKLINCLPNIYSTILWSCIRKIRSGVQTCTKGLNMDFDLVLQTFIMAD